MRLLLPSIRATRRWTRIARARRGIAAVEFALIAPLMLLIGAGVVETGTLVSTYSRVNRLALQYAISYADCSDSTPLACQTELTLYNTPATLTNIAPQLTQSNLTLRMFQVRMAGSVPTVVYSYPLGAALTASEIATAQANIADTQTGVVVTATYNHTLLFFNNIMAPIIGSGFVISYTIGQLKT